MWGLRGVTLAVVIGLVSACYEPPSACGIRCDVAAANPCPENFTCVNALCVPSNGDSCVGPSLDLSVIAVGARHACGLTPDGALYCWGDNGRGQTGTGSPDRLVPSPRRVGAETWDAVATGGEHSCGLRAGTVSCWGDNSEGQVAGQRGATFNSPTAVTFPNGVSQPSFSSIATGTSVSCGIASGALWCWGNGGSLGMSNNPPSAIQIGSLTDWQSVSVGYDHVCGLSGSLGAACFGGNTHAQVRAPAGSRVSTPTTVVMPNGLTAIQIIAGGEQSCAIASATVAATAGELVCWGRNSINLIDSTEAVVPTPTALMAGDDWTSVTLGGEHYCGIRGGMVRCWGRSYGGGALGGGVWNGDELVASAIVVAPGSQVSTGPWAPNGGAAIACLVDGNRASCWGDNTYAQLGTGAPSLRKSPAEVAPPSGTTWRDVEGGYRHLCGVTADGQLRCWGGDENAQITATIGRGTNQRCLVGLPCDVPRPIAPPAPRAEEVVVGRAHTCVREASEIRCWGNQGDLGGNREADGLSRLLPPQGAWTRLFGGSTATCAFAADQPYCWSNLGLNGSSDRPFLLPSATFPQVTDAAFGEARCVVTAGQRTCWGPNDRGQVGDGTIAASTTPTLVGPAGITAVEMTDGHGCALVMSGEVHCWGSNGSGESGIDPDVDVNNNVPTPAVIQTSTGPLTGCTALAVAGDHACAVCSGQGMCWGQNYSHELGRGDDSASSHLAGPIDLAGHTLVDVATYAGGGCVIDDVGAMFCWGDGTHGENGDGGASRNLPTPVGVPL